MGLIKYNKTVKYNILYYLTIKNNYKRNGK